MKKRIKITPEMVEAGLRAYYDMKFRDDRFEDQDEGIKEIYLAMVAAKDLRKTASS